MVTQLTLLFIFIPSYQAAGAAVSIVIMEFVVVLLFIFASKKIISDLN